MYQRTLTLGLLTLLTSLGAWTQTSSEGEEWRYSISFGAVYSPAYLGDDEQQISLFPNFRATYGDRFFASLGEGVGYNFIAGERWRIGVVAGYDFGRDEDGSNPLTLDDETTDLAGLGDVDGAVELGLRTAYEAGSFGFTFDVRQGLGGHEGLVGELSFSYQNSIKLFGRPMIFSISPHVDYTDGNYNAAFFSILPEQVVESGLSLYDADDDAFSYGAGFNFIVPHNERIATILFSDYTSLDDVMAESPLVLERGDKSQFTVGLMVSYTF